MNAEQGRLEQIKSQMTSQQRAEMAELLANELRRRKVEKRMNEKRSNSQVKSSRMDANLTPEQVREIYTNTHDKLNGESPSASAAQAADDNSVSVQLSPQARRQSRISLERFRGVIKLPNRNLLLLAGVLFFAIAKIVFSTGAIDSQQDVVTQQTPVATQAVVPQAAPTQLNQVSVAAPTTQAIVFDPSVAVTATQMKVLTALDSRRVELEQRRELYDRREAALKLQEARIAAQITELRSLTRQLSELREHHDHRYEARLEQLANVYGSMAPNEAAPLIAKLDENIALSLLRRLPGKRMGQILSLMEDQRAIELTKLLTDRQIGQ